MSAPDGIFIGVDWGSSRFRAYLMTTDGRVLDSVSSNDGIFQLAPGRFAGVFRERCGDWLTRYPGSLVVMSGMVGSRQGWLEMPYLETPVDGAGLAAGLRSMATALDARFYLVPGVQTTDAQGRSDVMRGEEVQIIGALGQLSGGDALLCLPGTHSKWAEVGRRQLRRFSTFMTGECFALMADQSSLGALIDEQAPWQDAAFEQGLALSRQPGGLLHQLFAPRAQVMTGQLAPAAVRSLLSGIVIGQEFAGASRLYGDDRPLAIVGDSELATRYCRAAAYVGRQVIRVDGERATTDGLTAIAQHLSGSVEGKANVG